MKFVTGSGFILSTLVACLMASQPVSADAFVTFNSADGTEITGVYIKPDTPAPKQVPGIVMLHGCGGMFTKSGKINQRSQQWIDLFAAEGWVILLPDSFGPRGKRTICTAKTRTITPQGHRQFDALGALKFMQAQPEIDPKRIALIGWSNGAMTGLHTIMNGSPATPDPNAPDFKTAVLFYPGCIAIGKEFPDFTARMPTLIQHGSKDNWTLPKPCKRLVERAEIHGGAPIEIDIYDGAVHGFDHPSSKLRTRNVPSKSNPNGRDVWIGTDPEARERAIERTMTWLKTHLGN